MKKLMTRAYTNYPDDVIREVKILSYDNNKYVAVQHLDGHVEHIKAGYLFRDKAITRKLRGIDLFIHGGGKRRDYQKHRKYTLTYSVWDATDDSPTRAFDTKAKAMRYAANKAVVLGHEFDIAGTLRQGPFSKMAANIAVDKEGNITQFTTKLPHGKYMRGYGKMMAKHPGKRPHTL
jgi:hypothetical protein